MKCPAKCEAEDWKTEFPVYWYDKTAEFQDNYSWTSTTTLATINGINCRKYERSAKVGSLSGAAVKELWFEDGSGEPTDRRVCRAVSVNGKTVEFENHGAFPAESAKKALFTPAADWNCPEKKCFAMADIFLVFDDSGSISNTNFNKMIQFGKDFANAFNIEEFGSHLGLVLFASSARLILPLTSSVNHIRNALDTISRTNGNTCIGCGIKTATDNFANARNQSTKIMIVLTDGYNNVGTGQNKLATAASNAKAAGILMFSIGVGSYKLSELQEIASAIPNTQSVFTTPNFDALQGILGNLTTASCLEVGTITPCGPQCRGFCACGDCDV